MPCDVLLAMPTETIGLLRGLRHVALFRDWWTLLKSAVARNTACKTLTFSGTKTWRRGFCEQPEIY